MNFCCCGIDPTLLEIGFAAVVPAESSQILVEKGQRNSISTEITLEERIPAPVSAGQRLGTLTIRSGDQILSQIPLVAESGVTRLSWSDLFFKIICQMAMAKES